MIFLIATTLQTKEQNRFFSLKREIQFVGLTCTYYVSWYVLLVPKRRTNGLDPLYCEKVCAIIEEN